MVDPVLDPATGYVYLRARYYDPVSAEYTTTDPLVSLTGQPYAYTNDNPLNYTDPSGLWLGMSWLPSPGQAVSAAGQWLQGAANTVAQNAVPVAEAVATVAACVTPLVDEAACPAAIAGVAALNVGINDVGEFNAVENGCSAAPYLRSDLFEGLIAGLGLGVAKTVAVAGGSLDRLASGTAGIGASRTAMKFLNGLGAGTGEGLVEAKSSSSNSGDSG